MKNFIRLSLVLLIVCLFVNPNKSNASTQSLQDNELVNQKYGYLPNYTVKNIESEQVQLAKSWGHYRSRRHRCLKKSGTFYRTPGCRNYRSKRSIMAREHHQKSGLRKAKYLLRDIAKDNCMRKTRWERDKRTRKWKKLRTPKMYNRCNRFGPSTWKRIGAKNEVRLFKKAHKKAKKQAIREVRKKMQPKIKKIISEARARINKSSRERKVRYCKRIAKPPAESHFRCLRSLGIRK